MYFVNPSRVRRNGTNDLMRVFDDFLAGAPLGTGNILPIDVREYEDHFLIEADVPGVLKEAIVLNYEQDLLSIEIEAKEQDDAQETYLHRERGGCMVERKLDLGDLDPERIEAELKDGVLRVKAYKSTPNNQRKTIEIK